MRSGFCHRFLQYVLSLAVGVLFFQLVVPTAAAIPFLRAAGTSDGRVGVVTDIDSSDTGLLNGVPDATNLHSFAITGPRGGQAAGDDAETATLGFLFSKAFARAFDPGNETALAEALANTAWGEVIHLNQAGLPLTIVLEGTLFSTCTAPANCESPRTTATAFARFFDVGTGFDLLRVDVATFPGGSPRPPQTKTIVLPLPPGTYQIGGNLFAHSFASAIGPTNPGPASSTADFLSTASFFIDGDYTTDSGHDYHTPQLVPVPTPASVALLLSGLLALASATIIRRRSGH
ncbi:MAG TPA: hypothetical protein VKF40_09960 [Burkholderiales bacterium]|nr:hypothetical protein [Burkholderiales bacterium]